MHSGFLDNQPSDVNQEEDVDAESLALICTTTIPANQVKGQKNVNNLESLLTSSYIATTEYEPPNPAQLQTAENLFLSLFQTGTFSPEDVIAWAVLNLKLQRVTEGNTPFAVVSEFDPTVGRGHGFYAIKLNGTTSSPRRDRILQGPHRPSDLYTHEIVYDLLVTPDFSSAAWSSTHRNNVDLCKHNHSYFNAFTLAATRAFSSPVIVQLHGFDKVGADTEADVIFSSTKIKDFPPLFEPTAACLKCHIGGSGFRVMKYPEEIQQLGGTLNINAQKFYAANRNGTFFHVETSKPLREELLVSQILREMLGMCF